MNDYDDIRAEIDALHDAAEELADMGQGKQADALVRQAAVLRRRLKED